MAVEMARGRAAIFLLHRDREDVAPAGGEHLEQQHVALEFFANSPDLGDRLHRLLVDLGDDLPGAQAVFRGG